MSEKIGKTNITSEFFSGRILERKKNKKLGSFGKVSRGFFRFELFFSGHNLREAVHPQDWGGVGAGGSSSSKGSII